MAFDPIPELRLSVLTKLISRFMGDIRGKLKLSKLFGEDRYPSDKIEWEAQIGNRGMTPFSNEDAPSPRVVPTGVSAHEARAAFWKEKMYFGSSFLNNIREPGTKEKFYATKKFLARQMNMLANRCARRKEWMVAKMLSGGGFEYVDPQGKTINVDYGVPTDNLIALETARKWSDYSADTSANPVEDIMDAKIFMNNANGTEIDYAMFTSEILKLLVMAPKIQSLLAKSQFGQGDLFARPLQVLGNLLDIPNMVLYNEMYQVRGWLTSAVSAGAGPHTIYVDDATDFEVGSVIYIHSLRNKTKEKLTVSAVSPTAGSVTATGTLTGGYRAKEDCVVMTRKFLPTNKFCMFSSQVEGQKIAEFMKSPFGLDRHYGTKTSRWYEDDPDGMWLRVENKGLPVLYFEDAIFNYTVA